MGKVETATKWMEDLARDDSHGYDQIYRWGEKGDYDCSAAVITAYETAGIPVHSKYGATYTGNMKSAFMKAGFQDVTSKVNLINSTGMVRGDVLLNQGHHTAIFCGDYMTAEASINEHGGITGGKPGDQTGLEILIRSYRDYPWDTVLRYPEELSYYETTFSNLTLWSEGLDVFRAKVILKARGFYKASINRLYGHKAVNAAKRFQKKAGLTESGNMDAPTWRTLLGLEIKNGKFIVNECKKGDKGTSVLLLQEFLKGLGYTSVGELDRIFGAKTEGALIEFKKNANKNGAKLTVNGVWDKKTIKYMIG